MSVGKSGDPTLGHWDPPVEAYDPYGPGVEVLDDVTGFQEPVTHHSDDVIEM
jgi:hypothetical protein